MIEQAEIPFSGTTSGWTNEKIIFTYDGKSIVIKEGDIEIKIPENSFLMIFCGILLKNNYLKDTFDRFFITVRQMLDDELWNKSNKEKTDV